MDDNDIVDLFLKRDEMAIKAVPRKYIFSFLGKIIRNKALKIIQEWSLGYLKVDMLDINLWYGILLKYQEKSLINYMKKVNKI